MPQVRFLGHSCITITEGEHKLVIDPFLTDNPQATVKADELRRRYRYRQTYRRDRDRQFRVGQYVRQGGMQHPSDAHRRKV
jgi:hypothetical protein